MTKQNFDYFTIKSKLFWNRLRETDDRGNFTIKLQVSPDLKTKLSMLGINTTNNDATAKKEEYKMGDAVTAKSKFPIKVLNSVGVEMTDDDILTIGNGTLVNATVHVFDWTHTGKKGRSLGMDKVEVLELVTYTPTVKTTTIDDIINKTPF